MCEPVTIAAVALTATQVASTVVQHNAQAQAAKGNEAAANEAAGVSQSALNARMLEERIAAGQDKVASARQAQSAVSLARLSALGAGVAGNSVDAQTHQIEGDLGRVNDSIDENLTTTELQIERGRAGVEAERKGRIAGVPAPNPFLTALTIAGQGLQAYTGYESRKPPK